MTYQVRRKSRDYYRTVFVKAGTKVHRLPHKSKPGKGMSYGEATGTLLEDARIGPQAGWDVYDIHVPGQEDESAYGFDLRRLPKRSKR